MAAEVDVRDESSATEAVEAEPTVHVRFAPKADKKQIVSVCPLCANTGHGQLFDHLVSALLERHYLKLIKSVRLSVEALGFKGSFVAFALF